MNNTKRMTAVDANGAVQSSAEYWADRLETATRPLTAEAVIENQQRSSALERLPSFEADTTATITQLKNAIDHLYVFNRVLVVALLVLLIAGGWLMLPMVVGYV